MSESGTADGRARLMAVLAWALLLLGLARALQLVLHVPLIGLGNNYDMIRVQACIDAYPARSADVSAVSNSWQGPIARYVFRDDVEWGCFLSTESGIALAMLPALRAWDRVDAEAGFPLRLVALLKLPLLCALLVLPLLALGKSPAAGAKRLGLATITAAIAADPAVTIYLASFYAEYSAFAFAWLAVALSWILLASPRPSRAWALVLGVATAAVVLSKLQHVGFALFLLAALLAASLLAKSFPPRVVMLAVLLGGSSATLVQVWHLNSGATGSISMANKTNTFLGAVLESSDDPERTARNLGLPARCGRHAGKNWFTRGMQQQHACPELLEISRARLAVLVAREPATIAGVMLAGIAQVRPWIPWSMGKVEGEEGAPLPGHLPTLDRLLAPIPSTPWFLLFVLPACVTLGAFALRCRPTPERAFAFVFLSLYPWFALASVVFGDGFADAGKQFHLGMACLLAWYGFTACLLIGRIARLGRKVDSNHAGRAPTATNRAGEVQP